MTAVLRLAPRRLVPLPSCTLSSRLMSTDVDQNGGGRRESLAAAIRRVESGQTDKTGQQSQVETPAAGSQGGFNQLFLPNRKLNAQKAIERLSGRSDFITRSSDDQKVAGVDLRPRHELMKPEDDWPSIWPAAASFRSSTVPLPVRMGFVKRPDKRPPFKTVGNLELIKIPNFLHLTPPAVKRHCDAIKKFFTTFPQQLAYKPPAASPLDARFSRQLADKPPVPQPTDSPFPIVLKYDTYIHQGTNIRDNRARVVTLEIPLNVLHLDEHANRKFIELCGDRYNSETGLVQIVCDQCPTRQQNRDHAYYLLTVLYHESQREEGWEKQAQKIIGDEMPVRRTGYRIPLDVESYKKEVLAKLGLQGVGVGVKPDGGKERPDGKNVEAGNDWSSTSWTN